MSGTVDHEYTDPRVLSAAVSAALATPSPTYMVASNTPQYVLFSFDGSKSVDMLYETLAFQKKMTDEGKPLHFTYFINAAYFLPEYKANLYQAPYQKPGVSNIGFSNSTADIAGRVHAFNEAVKAGNEIGSHTAGHFNGTDWSYENWKQEFNSFDTILFGTQRNMLPVAVEPWMIKPGQIKGFRAPSLGINENMYRVLGDFNFQYDSSGVGPEGNWPSKDPYGIWRIPLSIVFDGSERSPVVGMDYNQWQHQSHGQDTVEKGSAQWTADFNEVLKAYTDYFDTNYNGSRAPVVIGNHFSRWNDGVYWEVMKSFAEKVCGMPNVHCGTFSEFVTYVNTHGIPQLVPRLQGR